MIASFNDKETKRLFNEKSSIKLAHIAPVALRKLNALELAKSIDELRVPPSNRLEVLKGNRKGQYSIRINDQYRICFYWEGDQAYDVEIVDYH